MKKKPAYDPEEVAQQIACGMTSGVHLGTRRIFLTGEVDEEMAARFFVTFHALDATPGPIAVSLCSEGGSIDHGFAIYDTIRLSNNPVVIDVVGSAQSIAMLMLQAADLRRATPEARLMIHQGKLYTSDAAFNADDLKQHGHELSLNNDRYYKALSDGAKGKLTLSDVIDLCKKDTYFSAAEGLKHGLIDEVLQPTKQVILRRVQVKGRKRS
jgi:ATP-dependent Clp protease protease subunit